MTEASGSVTVQAIEGSAHQLKIGWAEVQTERLTPCEHSAVWWGWVRASHCLCVFHLLFFASLYVHTNLSTMDLFMLNCCNFCGDFHSVFHSVHSVKKNIPSKYGELHFFCKPFRVAFTVVLLLLLEWGHLDHPHSLTLLSLWPAALSCDLELLSCVGDARINRTLSS